MVESSGISFRRPWQSSVLLSLGLLFLPVSGCALLGNAGSWGWFVGASLLAFGGAIGASARDRRRTGASYALTKDGIEIHWEQHSPWMSVSRNEVLSGYEVPMHGSVELTLTGRRKLVIETADPAALLEHLGVAVQQRALTVPLRGTIGAFVLGLVTLLFSTALYSAFWSWLLFLISHDATGFAWIPAMLSIVATVVGVVRRFGFPRVIVGADGVRVRGTAAEPFVPYASIVGVLTHPSGIQIRLADGTFVQLETYGQSEAQITSLAARIGQGRAARAALTSANLDALSRGDRTIRAWIDDVRRVALTPPGFRDHAYSRDDFERILSDASSAPDQRIGAALALRFADPAARPRIRIAAAASANDDLRDALAACATEDDRIEDEVLLRATARRR